MSIYFKETHFPFAGGIYNRNPMSWVGTGLSDERAGREVALGGSRLQNPIDGDARLPRPAHSDWGARMQTVAAGPRW